MAKATVYYRSEIVDTSRFFEDKAERDAFDRKPQVDAAFAKLTDSNPELTKFLMDKEDEIQAVFETGTIQRVKKADRNKLKKALEKIVASGNKDFAFVADNAGAIADSFKWPAVARIKPEEKLSIMTATLNALTDNNAELVNWILASEAAILEAYEAGVVKRVQSPEEVARFTDVRNKLLAAKKAARDEKELAAAKAAGYSTAAEHKAAEDAKKQVAQAA